MDIQKFNLIIKIIIIFLGIILIALVLKYGVGDCDKLRFEIKGKILDAGEFMEIYSDKCLQKPNPFEMPTLNLSGLSNLS